MKLPDYADDRPFDYIILRDNKEDRYDNIADAISAAKKILEENPKENISVYRNSYAEDGSLAQEVMIWDSVCSLLISSDEIRELYEEADNHELIKGFVQKFGIESCEMLNQVRDFADGKVLENANHYHAIGLKIEPQIPTDLTFEEKIPPQTNPFRFKNFYQPVSDMLLFSKEEDIRQFFKDAQEIVKMHEMLYDCLVELPECKYDTEEIQKIADRHKIPYELAENFANGDISMSEFYHELVPYQSALSNTVLVLPEGMKALPESAFAEDFEIEKVIFPKSMEEVGKNAFFNCAYLKEIVFPDYFRSSYGCCLKEDAFTGCQRLESIPVIPDDINSEEYNNPFTETEYMKDILSGEKKCEESLFWNCNAEEQYHIASVRIGEQDYLDKFLKENIDSVIYEMLWCSETDLETTENLINFMFENCEPDLDTLKLVFDTTANQENIQEFMKRIIEYTERTNHMGDRIAMFDYQKEKGIYPPSIEEKFVL